MRSTRSIIHERGYRRRMMMSMKVYLKREAVVSERVTNFDATYQLVVDQESTTFGSSSALLLMINGASNDGVRGSPPAYLQFPTKVLPPYI